MRPEWDLLIFAFLPTRFNCMSDGSLGRGQTFIDVLDVPSSASKFHSLADLDLVRAGAAAQNGQNGSSRKKTPGEEDETQNPEGPPTIRRRATYGPPPDKNPAPTGESDTPQESQDPPPKRPKPTIRPEPDPSEECEECTLESLSEYGGPRGFSAQELVGKVPPVERSKWGKLFSGLFSFMMTSGLGNALLDKIIEWKTGRTYEEEVVNDILPEIFALSQTLIAVNNEFSNQSIHIRTPVAKKVNVFVRIGRGISKLFGFGGKPSDGVDEALGGASELLSEPSANTYARDAQDWAARYYATLDTVVRHFNDNYKQVYGINGTKIRDRGKLRQDVDILATHLTRWTEMNSFLRYQNLDWGGAQSTGLGPGSSYYSNFSRMANGSTPQQLLTNFRESFRSYEASTTNQGKESAIQQAMKVRRMFETATYELLFIKGSWQSDIPWVNPISKGGRPPSGVPFKK